MANQGISGASNSAVTTFIGIYDDCQQQPLATTTPCSTSSTTYIREIFISESRKIADRGQLTVLWSIVESAGSVGGIIVIFLDPFFKFNNLNTSQLRWLIHYSFRSRTGRADANKVEPGTGTGIGETE
ncbi:MAG: hypothetical protein Q8L60_17285 [Gammaproteobacteria bacterium]|nr:hypothetical protein [Gammaproteobacteria bacterium]